MFTTNEFVSSVKAMGYEVERDSNILIINSGDRLMGKVNVTKVDDFFIGYALPSEINTPKRLELLTYIEDYALTPLDKRGN